jgi:hypothetical protein
MCAKCGCGCKAGKPVKGCKCTCPTCAGAKDKKQDAKVMKGMSSKEKSSFEKADKKMDKKKPSAKADMKMDKALAKKIKKKAKKK